MRLSSSKRVRHIPQSCSVDGNDRRVLDIQRPAGTFRAEEDECRSGSEESSDAVDNGRDMMRMRRNGVIRGGVDV